MEQEEMEKVMKRLKEKQLKVAFAESITGGKVTQEFSCIPEAGDVLLGGIVTYSSELKMKVLGVKNDTICTCTAESQETTNEMVWGLKDITKADICIAVTGLASPGGSETPDKPVGTTFFSIMVGDKLYEYREEFAGDPDEIKDKTVDYIFKKLKIIAFN